MSSAPVVDRIRIIPRPGDFLDRNVGASGEVFYNSATNSLRVYSGKDQSGFEIARADLANVDTSQFQINSNIATVTYAVTIENTGDGNKYVLNGKYWPELNFVVGYTYVFDQNDPTNVYYPNPTGGANNQHPLNFSADDINGEPGGGTVYTENVTYKLDNTVVTKQQYWDGFEAASQRSVEILVTSNTPSTLYYWCQNHLNMGKSISVAVPGSATDKGASVNVSTSSPNNPEIGNIWFNSHNGKIYIYMSDEDGTEQWVQPAVPTFSGDYADLINTPTLATVATSGSYTDLINTPTLATVATSGSYTDLSDTPVLAAVATSGSYTDLSNTPTLATVATSGSYTDLINTPTLATVATSGSYTDLSDTPSIGTIANQDSDSVAITGGSVTGITDLAVEDGGTGASDSATARTNLGLGNVDNVSAADLRDRSTHTGSQSLSTISDAGTIASQDADNVAFTGGIIEGTSITGGTIDSASITGALNNFVTSISPSDWSQASGSDPYIAVKTVQGILPTDVPIVDIDTSSTAFESISTLLGEWAEVYRVEAASGDEIIFYALTEPTTTFNVNILVTR